MQKNLGLEEFGVRLRSVLDLQLKNIQTMLELLCFIKQTLLVFLLTNIKTDCIFHLNCSFYFDNQKLGRLKTLY